MSALTPKADMPLHRAGSNPTPRNHLNLPNRRCALMVRPGPIVDFQCATALAPRVNPMSPKPAPPLKCRIRKSGGRQASYIICADRILRRIRLHRRNVSANRFSVTVHHSILRRKNLTWVNAFQNGLGQIYHGRSFALTSVGFCSAFVKKPNLCNSPDPVK